MFRISASRVSASHRPSFRHETIFCSHEFPSLHPTRSGPEWCCSTCVPLCEMRLAAHNSTPVSRWPSKRPRKGFPRSRLQSNTYIATRSRRTESGRRPLRQAEWTLLWPYGSHHKQSAQAHLENVNCFADGCRPIMQIPCRMLYTARCRPGVDVEYIGVLGCVVRDINRQQRPQVPATCTSQAQSKFDCTGTYLTWRTIRTRQRLMRRIMCTRTCESLRALAARA